jgi:hypothetical protein
MIDASVLVLGLVVSASGFVVAHHWPGLTPRALWRAYRQRRRAQRLYVKIERMLDSMTSTFTPSCHPAAPMRLTYQAGAFRVHCTACEHLILGLEGPGIREGFEQILAAHDAQEAKETT